MTADFRNGPDARFVAVMRSAGVEDGLAARLADPLWMLARQWQFGEFRGDDAGSLVSLQFQANAHAPTWWRPEPDPSQPTATPWQSWTVRTGPLEAVIEAEADDGTAWRRLRIEGGVAARRALCAAGLPAAAAQLPAAFGWPALDPGSDTDPTAPDPDPAAVPAVADPGDRVVMACTADATRLAAIIEPWADPATVVPAAVLTELAVAATDAATFATAMRTWYQWWRGCTAVVPTGQDQGPVDPPSWDPQRLEHRGSLGFASAPVLLHVDRHPGGPLDWYSVDIEGALPTDTAAAPTAPQDLQSPRRISTLTVPQPARMAGMPANRFWEFEDARVDFGSIDASPADLSRLLLVEYTTVYDHDWYLVPLRVPVGALIEVDQPVKVVDSFGQSPPLEAFAEKAGANTRIFTLSSPPSQPPAVPPADPLWGTRWFWFAPRLPSVLDSDPVEQIALRRDEMANLAWAIVGNVGDSAGRVVTLAAGPAATTDTSNPATGTPRYTVESTVPGNWFPLVPTPLPASTAYLLALRSRDGGPNGLPVTPPGRMLAAGDKWQIHEEELSPAGLTLTRSRSLARWHDGRIYTWTARTSWAGGGEADSGLTWDYLR